MKMIYLLGILLAVIAISGCTGNVVSDNAPTVNSNQGQDINFEIPLSSVSDTLSYYVYDDNGVKINYFVVRGTDNEIKTAFDACEVCGGYKGYRQEGGDVVCNNCGRHFKINDLGEKNRGGGCWPAHIEHQIIDGNIMIKESELKKGRSYFV